MTTRKQLLVPALLGGLSFWAACGPGDGKPTARPAGTVQPGTPSAALAAQPGAQPGQPAAGVLTAYIKLEDVCLKPAEKDGKPVVDAAGKPVMEPDPMCCRVEMVDVDDPADPTNPNKKIKVKVCKREELDEEAFRVDRTGDLNRDPFHSYVIDTKDDTTQEPGVKPTEMGDPCENAKTVAPDYGLRDLHLVGIVSKGTKAYSLWVDSQQTGYRAKRGDCLSKDHVKVKDIGDNVVILQLLPPPGSPMTPIREEPIALHPEDDQLNNQLNIGNDE